MSSMAHLFSSIPLQVLSVLLISFIAGLMIKPTLRFLTGRIHLHSLIPKIFKTLSNVAVLTSAVIILTVRLTLLLLISVYRSMVRRRTDPIFMDFSFFVHVPQMWMPYYVYSLRVGQNLLRQRSEKSLNQSALRHSLRNMYLNMFARILLCRMYCFLPNFVHERLNPSRFHWAVNHLILPTFLLFSPKVLCCMIHSITTKKLVVSSLINVRFRHALGTEFFQNSSAAAYCLYLYCVHALTEYFNTVMTRRASPTSLRNSLKNTPSDMS